MLVLSRKLGESIVIGEDIHLTVLDSQNGEVKLGIAAPKEVSILRKEIYDEVKEQNRASAEVDPKSLGDLIKQFSDKGSKGEKKD